MGVATLLRVSKDERMMIYIKGAGGKGFVLSVTGPGQLSAVKFGKEIEGEKMGNNAVALANWYRDQGDATLNVDYPLNEDSIVFEIGGYEGLWASRIAEKYNPNIHLFEPVKRFCDAARATFQNNPKVSIFQFGLSDYNGPAEFDIDDDRSRTSVVGKKTEIVSIRDVAEIITSPIDLININIEGGEYDLVTRMIESGVVAHCHNIQVQFHDDYPNCVELRNGIREKLAETHTETYNYPFVWESWRLK